MATLGNILEPGERVMLRSTDGGSARYIAGMFLLLGVVTWVRGVSGFETFGPQFWTATLFLLVFVLLVLAITLLWTRWKWAITDRRILKRYGLFSSDIGEMRHETVREVRLDDRTLSVYGRDYRWSLPISRNFCRADILHDLFGARMPYPGGGGQPARPLVEMLEPGETLRWRYSPLITDLLPWLLLLSGPLAFIVVLGWPEFARDYMPGLNMVLIPYVILPGEIAAAWRRGGWRTVLTDRRLLRRRHNAPLRCDAVQLDAVTEAYWDTKGWELVVVSPGRRDTIFCVPWTARRILKALKQNDRGEALA